MEPIKRCLHYQANFGLLLAEWKKERAACLRIKAKRVKQVMVPLPLSRLETSMTAFTRAAMDFAGPYIMIQGKGKPKCKRYLCLFTFLASRAIHLEVALGLDTDSFLTAFDRMCNQRGVPEEMISNNGTNFVGTNQELRNLRDQLVQDNKLKDRMTSKGIK